MKITKKIEKIIKDEKIRDMMSGLLTQECTIKNYILRYLIKKSYPSEREIEKYTKIAEKIIKYMKINQDELVYKTHDEDEYLG